MRLFDLQLIFKSERGVRVGVFNLKSEVKAVKIVRVHNPSRIKVAKRKVKKTMARRKTTRRRRRAVSRTRAANPRRRRRRSTARRRHNPGFVARSRRTSNPRRRRRRFGRRRNPSAIRIGQLAKDAIYGAGGAILTRAGTQIATSFVPQIASLGGSYGEPIIQAAVAATVVRWAGTKFLGKPQGDTMMIGGLISAGLSLADRLLPNLQGQIVGLVPGQLRPAQNAAIPAGGAGLGDVYDVDMTAAGFGDVEDVDMQQFNGLNGL